MTFNTSWAISVARRPDFYRSFMVCTAGLRDLRLVTSSRKLKLGRKIFSNLHFYMKDVGSIRKPTIARFASSLEVGRREHRKHDAQAKAQLGRPINISKCTHLLNDWIFFLKNWNIFLNPKIFRFFAIFYYLI